MFDGLELADNLLDPMSQGKDVESLKSQLSSQISQARQVLPSSYKESAANGLYMSSMHSYHPSSYLGKGTTTTPSSPSPIIRQHTLQSTHGLSPRRISPTMEYMAGTFVQARQSGGSGGVI
jgi:hypothetical protein